MGQDASCVDRKLLQRELYAGEPRAGLKEKHSFKRAKARFLELDKPVPAGQRELLKALQGSDEFLQHLRTVSKYLLPSHKKG